MRTLWWAVTVVVLSSCNEPEKVPDAGAGEDAGTPVRQRSVVTSIRMPTSNAQAREMAVDIDGDGNVDNQLGQVTASFAQQGFDTQADSDLAFARSVDLTLLQATTVGTDTTVFALTGKNPQPSPCADGGDTTCGHHFAGGSFEFEQPTPPALDGTSDGGVVTVSGAGPLQFPVAYFGAVVKVTVLKPHLRINADGSGTFAGAMLASETSSRLGPAAQAHFATLIARDCTGGAAPQCGCTAGSTGASLLALFEVAPKDCVISLSEINDNSVFMALLAPDQTIGGMPAVSLGFEFRTAAATFNGP